MNEFWMDEFGWWTHTRCGHYAHINRQLIGCPACNTTALAPWAQTPEPRMPYWYGGVA